MSEYEKDYDNFLTKIYNVKSSQRDVPISHRMWRIYENGKPLKKYAYKIQPGFVIKKKSRQENASYGIPAISFYEIKRTLSFHESKQFAHFNEFFRWSDIPGWNDMGNEFQEEY